MKPKKITKSRAMVRECHSRTKDPVKSQLPSKLLEEVHKAVIEVLRDDLESFQQKEKELQKKIKEIKAEKRTEAQEHELSFPSDFILDLQAWADLVRGGYREGKLLIVLDQFEEYFQHHSQAKDQFAKEFKNAVNWDELSVNFLISIQEAWLGQLDYFEEEIPDVLSNLIHIEHLGETEAKEAIKQPIQAYNLQQTIIGHLKNGQVTELHGEENIGKSYVLNAGICYRLRKRAKENLKKNLPPEFVVIMFDSWGGDPVSNLKQQIEIEIKSLFEDREVKSVLPSLSLDKTLRDWTTFLEKEFGEKNCKLLIILDQFEQYFQNPSQENGEKTFTTEFEDAVKTIKEDKLPVNFLISIRTDQKSNLDQFKINIESSLELSLSEDNFPVIKPSDDQAYKIDPNLVTEVLNQSDQFLPGDLAEERIEPLYLQLIMMRLWNKEIDLGSRCLRQETFTKILGGVEKIAREHLKEKLNSLDNSEQETAARIFNYLVTPSSARSIAHTVDDLVKYASSTNYQAPLKRDQVKTLLEKLSSGSSRILRQVAKDHYEIFFSVLAKAILDWLQIRRTVKQLEEEGLQALQEFDFSQLKALVAVVQSGQKLKNYIEEGLLSENYLVTSSLRITLQQIINDIREWNEFQGHEKNVWSVSFSPNGKKLATGSADGTVRLWDLQGNRLNEFQGHEKDVWSVKFSPDGKKLATASGDGKIRLWNLQDKEKPRVFKCHQGWIIWAVSFSPDGKKLATGSADGTARLWDLQGNRLNEFQCHGGYVLSVSFSPDGQFLATASEDGKIRLWNLKSQEVRIFQVDEIGAVYRVTFSPEGKYLATASADGTVRLWNLLSKKQHAEAELEGHQAWVLSVKFSPDGHSLATGSADGTVRLWDLQSKKPCVFKGYLGFVWSVSFSPDGKKLATASGDGKIRLWDLQGNRLNEFNQHQGRVWAISFSPDGKKLATGSADGTARLWDLQDKEEPRVFKDHQDAQDDVWSVSFSPDKKYLATTSADAKIRLWDLHGKEKPRVFKGHQGWVYSVSFSPDGKKLATGSADGTARLWNLEGKQLAEFKEHEVSVLSVNFSPDGQYLATGLGNGTAKLWQIEDFDQLLKRGQNWLKDYFISHPEDLENLAPPIIPVSRDESIPLSFPQQQLWLFAKLYPEPPVYNETITIQMRGDIKDAALEQSLTELVRRHEILRTTFAMVDTEPVQVINPPSPFTLTVMNLRQLPKTDREAEARRLATAELKQPFNLGQGPLLRATLMQLGDEEYWLFIAVHHILLDGVSIYNIFLPELETLYTAFAAGQPSPLPELKLQYADFAAWQRQWLQGEVLSSHLAYWKTKLAKLPSLQLPVDRPRPAQATFQGERQCLALSEHLSEKLKELSRQEGVTLFMTIAAAIKILLYRYSSQEDIVLGTFSAERNRPEVEGIMGYFVNPLVLRTDLSGNPSFRQLLQRVREKTLEAYAHQYLPFAQLVAALQPEYQGSQNPLFQVAFILNPPLPAGFHLDWKSSQLDIHSGTAEFDLTFELDERPEGLIGRLEYSTDLFDDDTITRMIGHFQTLLEGIVANPEQRISELPLLTEAESHQLLVEWNDTQADYPQDQCIHQLFEAQVEQTPEAEAVVLADQQLTYQQLNRRANQLAHHLQALGVGPEVLVGIYMERSIEMIVGLLGILKAGGAYVPLDTTYPQERIAFMLSDAQVPVVLTQQHLVEGLPPSQALIVSLDSDWETIAIEPEENLVSEVAADNLVYVIYTSGSTGTPKGVAVSHRAIARLVLNTNYIKLEPNDRVAQVSNSSFDAATFEFWGALLNGACLVVIPREIILSPHVFAKCISENQIDVLFLTTGLFNLMASEAPWAFNSVRELLFGGEVDNPSLARRVLQHGPPQRLIHFYGPTENTTFTTWHLVQEVPAGAKTLPIGRPIYNTQLYVLDSNLQLVPIGKTGELYIGGDGLARGYLNHPELTTKAFIPNPFSSEPGARLYKTGDLVCYLPDGNIEFIGRIDYQVKIHGFRVELEEVESVLAQHPNVLQVVVIAREDRPGDKRLLAYIVPDKERRLSSDELRRFLQGKLPEYMVPSAFIMLDAMPLTPNGKVNRRALPAPDISLIEPELGLVAPRTSTEKKLAGIWAEVLSLKQVGIYDNFFNLGGHSLLAAQVVARISQVFQVDLPLNALFEKPTIASLSELVIATEFEQADSSTLEQILAEVEGLSDEELNRLSESP